MVFSNEEKGTVVVVLGKDKDADCTVEALDYVARKVAKSLRSARSVDKMDSFRVALYLLRAVPIEKYVKPTYTGKAKLNMGMDKFDLDFGTRLATARARRAYWRDVAAYMAEVEDLIHSLAASFSFKMDGMINTLEHFEDAVAELHEESAKTE